MEQMAALRAEWFARVEEAIESSQRVAWQLGTRAHTSAEARTLYSRLEAARIELDSLRGLADARFDATGPDCIGKLWGSPLLDPTD